MKTLIAFMVATILLTSVVIYTEALADKPYYKKGTHKIIALVKFQNDCWDEIYARATPKNHNSDVLNKQYIDNNDEPDNGPSEVIKLSWKFKTDKFDKTIDTNEGKIRTYVTIELVGEIEGATVTKYKTFDAGKKKLDFGTFYMKTNPDLCDPDFTGVSQKHSLSFSN